tara:strand:- start:314 stop:553 length:240 start_codon:yes stop_codon:yes gene_type:complete
MEKRFIVLDTETTGLEVEKGHRIIEIGGVVMNGRKKTSETFHAYINPQREIDRKHKQFMEYPMKILRISLFFLISLKIS